MITDGQVFASWMKEAHVTLNDHEVTNRHLTFPCWRIWTPLSALKPVEAAKAHRVTVLQVNSTLPL